MRHEYSAHRRVNLSLICRIFQSVFPQGEPIRRLLGFGGRLRRQLHQGQEDRAVQGGVTDIPFDPAVEIKQRNPRFGCPRIADIVTLTFGIPINKDVVRRILATHYKPLPSQPAGPSWLTFIGHCRDSLWSVDLFRCESLTLNSNWVLVVMDQYSRSIVGFSVHSGNVDGIALCRMFNQASSGRDPPCYLSSDNDPLFRFHRWQANLRILEIEEIKTVPFTPISHPFVERLIGTIRREYLDHVPFWNSLDLQRKLDQFKKYYNQHRTHTSLAGQTPDDFGRLRERSTASLSNFIWKHHCNGLFVTPIPA